MAESIMRCAIQRALQAWRNGLDSFVVFDKVFRIQHAHDNEYQVLLPGPHESEIFRIYDGARPHVIIV